MTHVRLTQGNVTVAVDAHQADLIAQFLNTHVRTYPVEANKPIGSHDRKDENIFPIEKHNAIARINRGQHLSDEYPDQLAYLAAHVPEWQTVGQKLTSLDEAATALGVSIAELRDDEDIINRIEIKAKAESDLGMAKFMQLMSQTGFGPASYERLLAQYQLLPYKDIQTLVANRERFQRIMWRLKYRYNARQKAPPAEERTVAQRLHEEVVVLPCGRQIHVLDGLSSRSSTAQQADQLSREINQPLYAAAHEQFARLSSP